MGDLKKFPNVEIREIFETTIKRWFEDSAKIWDRKHLFDAVWEGDSEEITLEMSKLLRKTISYHDYREDFYHACRYMFTGMIICLVIYTLIPNGLSLRPEITNTNILSRLVGMIWSVDTATNVCPSIHVFNSIAVNTVIQHSNAFKHKKLVRFGSYVLALAICMSTVFLKQHSVIDVFWACVLGLVLYPLSYKSVFDDSRESECNVKAL